MAKEDDPDIKGDDISIFEMPTGCFIRQDTGEYAKQVILIASPKDALRLIESLSRMVFHHQEIVEDALKHH